MLKKPSVRSSELSLMSVPAFWPMAMATKMLEEGTELYARNVKFAEEEIKIHDDLRPKLATSNHVRLDLRTMLLREYGKPGGIPTLIDAPHAGHTAVIADYHKGQSLVQTLLANGIGQVALTDWKAASDDMKDLEIDNYLAEIIVVIDSVSHPEVEAPATEDANISLGHRLVLHLECLFQRAISCGRSSRPPLSALGKRAVGPRPPRHRLVRAAFVPRCRRAGRSKD